jgi:hypothetical protein
MGSCSGLKNAMNIKIPHLEKYPPETQAMLLRKIEDIINETFVFSADYDYLNARWLSINRLYRPFFWAALQAIEKYLKANLLYHGVCIKKYRHNILRMALDLEDHDTFLKDVELVARTEHQMLQKDGLWGSSDIYVFLKTIEKYGDPNNRYDFYGSCYEFSHLFKLDHVIYSLRSKVTDIDLLYKVKDLDRLSFFAYEQNYYFAPIDYEHKSIYGLVGANISVPSIEIAVKGGYGHPQVFERWLKDNILIKDSHIDKMKNS